MHKKLLFTFVLSASFFIVCLGMKVPDLHKKGPGPHPRAVVENLVEKAQDEINHLSPAFDVCLQFSIQAPIRHCLHVSFESSGTLVSVAPVCSVSRAPPLIPSA